VRARANIEPLALTQEGAKARLKKAKPKKKQ